MIENIQRTADEFGITCRYALLPHCPQHSGRVVDIDIIIDDDNGLGPGHLSRTPDRGITRRPCSGYSFRTFRNAQLWNAPNIGRS